MTACEIFACALIARVEVLSEVTCTGVVRLVVVPSPSCPYALLPHAHTVPSPFSASACVAPAAIAITLDSPLTATGEVRVVVVPSPIWPPLFAPQAQTVPSVFNA